MNQPAALQTGYRILYKNHGDTIGYWEGWAEPPNKVILRHAKALDAKVVEHLYETEAKNVGRANEVSPLDQALNELDSRTRKQLDKGYVHSANQAALPSTNTLGLARPMLATPLEKVGACKIDWENAFAQPKLDGHRALYARGTLYSRQGKELELPHLVRAIEESGLGDLHLDGELYIHGYSLQELSTLIKRQQQGTEHLEYHIYDIVRKAPFPERIVELTQAFANAAPHIRLRLVETRYTESMARLSEHHQEFRKAGYEGTMLRFGEEPYRDGKRSRTLLKLKEFQDAEFTIVGVEAGKPYITAKHTFHVPVWVLDAGNGKTFTTTAQGDMHQKQELWDIRHSCIGKQLTVKYHYLSKEGIPQLPVALRFLDQI